MRILTILSLTALVFACTPAFGQQTTGTVRGRVVDQQKAAIQAAVVVFKNLQTGFTRTETTDDGGTYRAAGLAVGLY